MLASAWRSLAFLWDNHRFNASALSLLTMFFNSVVNNYLDYYSCISFCLYVVISILRWDKSNYSSSPM